MLRPVLDVSSLNVVLSVLGIFILLSRFISFKIKQRWYLGDALPAFVLGVLLGPVGARFLDVSQWGDGAQGQKSAIAYGLTRLVIGIQLVKAGYELPKRYLRQRGLELTICLLPAMSIVWLVTSGFIMLIIPRITFLSALIIGACVTCTDPVLSQAIAKGPFADNYVRRPLREFISAEAGGNDGFGFPFLLLAVSLLRYAAAPANAVTMEDFDLARGTADQLGTSGVGRFGGGVKHALKHWAVEGVLYMIIMGAGYGALVGFLSRKFVNIASKRRWIDNEGFLLVPLAMGLFVVGTCGCIGSDDTLACFIAGNVLNWDGRYHSETLKRHDSFNPAIEALLNFGAFIFLGAIMPWGFFQTPDTTGITVGRLMGLGVLILFFRRIPAIMMAYRFIPHVCQDWKEALFMGYFGPIGIGAISYVEYARRLFPDPGESDVEINNLTGAMIPVVYWLVLFSIIVHGVSVPILSLLYRVLHVPRICDHPVEITLLSTHEPLPNNSTAVPQRHSAIVNNQFARGDSDEEDEEQEENQQQQQQQQHRLSLHQSIRQSMHQTIRQVTPQRLSHLQVLDGLEAHLRRSESEGGLSEQTLRGEKAEAEVDTREMV
ncbi:hypothetical protein ASPZODRAFT_134125 [Penicilliopsis zonata CBS 506.65]|uniref:Cation/H+ exchanger transmembrane domain-containing protein n=1 Tax=Penicilliopsis zonata CBS 506.65 TaxID=1073090 RepID=A0A1L9SEE4_9EURO|nr:hypothetical protein ASPZODRAFT_134125 [Penicilliopsis zonata CBS 506.65]OJJ45467.1 hypothetical protein ASPZODRAFT_134125 [Penicilliopsis zonata CBS 506.65]